MKEPLSYWHVDVFTPQPLSGNGLCVFFNCDSLSKKTMQTLTQEMRQYESLFLFPTEKSNIFGARIFTVEEELDFAGHPLLGAACALHEKDGQEKEEEWTFQLREKTVAITTTRKEHFYFATMEQGIPQVNPPLDSSHTETFLKAFNLSKEDLHPNLPLQVVSTGLPYLIIPVKCLLDKVSITTKDLADQLQMVGAKFAYILHVSEKEGRNWDNEGKCEDIATGSAAGPVGAYLTLHKIIPPNEEFVLHQGRFLGRPSQLYVKVEVKKDAITSVKVSGYVSMVAKGTFLCPL